MKRSLVIYGLLVIAIIAIAIFSRVNYSGRQNNQENNITDSAVKITGIVTDTDNACTHDGLCRLKVNGEWVQYEGGGEAPKGKLIGVNFSKEMVGKKVEVCGKRIPGGGISIFDDTAYYIKLVD